METPTNNAQSFPKKTNDLAVASLVLAILGVFIPIILSIAAIICGHKARANFRKGIAVSGDGLALAGLIVGYVALVFWTISLVVTIGFYGLLFSARHAWSPNFVATSSTALATPFQKGSEPYRGAMLFQQKGCINCHMVSNVGGTPGVIVGSSGRRYSDLTEIADRQTPAEMRDVIIRGGKNMPAFGQLLKPEETQSIVTYLSTLHSSNPKTPSPQSH